MNNFYYQCYSFCTGRDKEYSLQHCITLVTSTKRPVMTVNKNFLIIFATFVMNLLFIVTVSR
jgi:hypothetical protein